MDSSLWLILPYGPAAPRRDAAFVRYYLAMTRKRGGMEMPMTPQEFFDHTSNAVAPKNALSFRGVKMITPHVPYTMTGQVYAW